jgi:hypothetical protein
VTDLTKLAERLEVNADDSPVTDSILEAARILRTFAAAAGELPEEPRCFSCNAITFTISDIHTIKLYLEAIRTAAIAARAECDRQTRLTDEWMERALSAERTLSQIRGH